MKPFQWRPSQLSAKLDARFEPLLESYSVGTMPRGNRSYFVLARWGEEGYMASARRCVSTEAEVLQECRITLGELQVLKERLYGISVPLGHSRGNFSGCSGTVRIYHSRAGGIDLHYKNTEHLEWQSLLNLIWDMRKSLVPEPPRQREVDVAPALSSTDRDALRATA